MAFLVEQANWYDMLNRKYGMFFGCLAVLESCYVWMVKGHMTFLVEQANWYARSNREYGLSYSNIIMLEICCVLFNRIGTGIMRFYAPKDN